jgi:hypothetical protein
MKRRGRPRAPAPGKTSRAAATVEMTVSHLSVDPFTDMPILILKDQSGDEAVPIWIGLVEAGAIAAELEEIALDRPMTHDLMASLLRSCGGEVIRVELTDVRDHTYFATIHVRREPPRKGGRAVCVAVDSRPSDAIALALRVGAPIRVARKVIERSRLIDLSSVPPLKGKRASTPSPPQLREILENLSDEEFGKWKM